MDYSFKIFVKMLFNNNFVKICEFSMCLHTDIKKTLEKREGGIARLREAYKNLISHKLSFFKGTPCKEIKRITRTFE
jgi:hypothetical protein